MIAFDIAIVAQKVKVQCCYIMADMLNLKKWVGCWWIISRWGWLLELLTELISDILTSSLLTFSVIYTFYFYIASQGLKIYQKYLIKKVPDFPFLEKFIRDNLNDYLRNSFLEGLYNFSLLLLLFDSSNLVSQAT